jgi:hypothetical protein
MDSCEGCVYLNAKYYRGAICRKGTTEPEKDPLSGNRYVTVMYLDKARAEGGICGPDRKLFKPKFWKLIFG